MQPETPKLFGWPDVLVLAGAAILVPAALVQGNWFFLGIAVAIAAAVGVRIGVTRWLMRRTPRD
jgi:hypothetical protein